MNEKSVAVIDPTPRDNVGDKAIALALYAVDPSLGPGLLDASPGAGFIQGRWRDGDTVDRFDTVVGYGPIIVADAALEIALAPLFANVKTAGVKLVFVSTYANRDGDINATYGDWLRNHCCDIVTVRGDFHV